jgi:hypothetical protein
MTRHLLTCLTTAGLALAGCESAPERLAGAEPAVDSAATYGATRTRAHVTARGAAAPNHSSGEHPAPSPEVAHGPRGHGTAQAHDPGAAQHRHRTEVQAPLAAELHTTPSPAQAGAPVTLAFTVKDAGGAVVRELAISHEKPMHLLAVSRDLATFQHLHPEPSADGAYRVSTRFPSGGDYVLFADYRAEGSPQVVQRFGLSVAGAGRAPVALVESASATQEADGLRLTLRTDGVLRAGGGGTVLRFDVKDAQTGKPAIDLEPYLGAMAHFVLVSEDTQSLLHAHPLEAVGAGVSAVSAHTTFPAAGLYKLWVQLQRRGRVVTVPYVLRVQAPAQPAPAHEAHAGHAH